MTAKTYTKRENAKRAAIAAGVPAELVEITVHKDAEGVRFGWKAKDAAASAAQGAANTPAATATESEPVAAPAAAHVVTTSKPKQAAAPKVPREERNGVKRPRAGGACAAVWEYLDQNGNMQPKDLKPVAAEKGWNENNALIELYGWRKFMGLSRAAAK
ncbi:hypothetical protein [Pseudomonas aeruginosa]|uniref:hypothetical protein n=1 Tax=Pseudomonas aeruginosa TaxID=287 RepID=UPI001D0B6197|nr:hypothetical protein [Pseudomonas aeruginosa]MCC0375620.1 hypothetical protein [Pseudomonas aeruginosa]